MAVLQQPELHGQQLVTLDHSVFPKMSIKWQLAGWERFSSGPDHVDCISAEGRVTSYHLVFHGDTIDIALGHTHK